MLISPHLVLEACFLLNIYCRLIVAQPEKIPNEYKIK